jgi:hypothetical protein
MEEFRNDASTIKKSLMPELVIAYYEIKKSGDFIH